MDKVIIYISYDDSRYMNYYHVICNDQKVIEFCPEEKLEMVFSIIKKYINNIDLCIVKSKTAYTWDFERDFNDNGIALKKDEKYKLNELCTVINQALNIEKTEDELELAFEGRLLLKTVEENIEDMEETLVQDEEIQSGTVQNEVTQTDKVQTEEIQPERILKSNDEGITEFARIIKQKYKIL